MNACGTCWWFLKDETPVEGRDGVCRHYALLDPQKEWAPRLAKTEQCIAPTTTGTYWRPQAVALTAKKMLKDYLTRNGYDGLVNEDVPCGCLVNDLAPCDGNVSACVAGWKEDVPASVRCGCEGAGTDHWHVTTAPVDPGFVKLLADAANWRCMSCGQQPEQQSGSWRWAGTGWEHYHGYPIGHVAAERKPLAGAVEASHEIA